MKKIILTLLILAFACVGAFAQSKFSEKKVKDKIESIKKERQVKLDQRATKDFLTPTMDAYVISPEALERLGNISGSMNRWKAKVFQLHEEILAETATPSVNPRMIPPKDQWEKDKKRDMEYFFTDVGGVRGGPSYLLQVSPGGTLVSWTVKSTMVNMRNDTVFVRTDQVEVYENTMSGGMNRDYIRIGTLEEFSKSVYKYKNTGFLFIACQWEYTSGRAEFVEVNRYSPLDLK